MGQTRMMTPGTNKMQHNAEGKPTSIQVVQCDVGSLFSRILTILGACATVYSQYRALCGMVTLGSCTEDSCALLGGRFINTRLPSQRGVLTSQRVGVFPVHYRRIWEFRRIARSGVSSRCNAAYLQNTEYNYPSRN